MDLAHHRPADGCADSQARTLILAASNRRAKFSLRVFALAWAVSARHSGAYISNTPKYDVESVGATLSVPKRNRSGCRLITAAVRWTDCGVAMTYFATSSHEMSK